MKASRAKNTKHPCWTIHFSPCIIRYPQIFLCTVCHPGKCEFISLLIEITPPEPKKTSRNGSNGSQVNYSNYCGFTSPRVARKLVLLAAIDHLGSQEVLGCLKGDATGVHEVNTFVIWGKILQSVHVFILGTWSHTFSDTPISCFGHCINLVMLK